MSQEGYPDPTAEGAIRSKHYERRKNPNSIYAILNRPDKIQLQIRGKLMQAAALRSCLGPQAITYDKDKVQTSPSDKMVEIMAKIEELDREVDRLRADKAQAILLVTRMAHSLPDIAQQTIILEYYLGGLSMEEIAQDIGYSASRTYSLRDDAVRQLGKNNNFG